MRTACRSQGFLRRPRRLAADPSTGVYPNGWFEINQAMLRATGHECGIACSDYDFTRD